MKQSPLDKERKVRDLQRHWYHSSSPFYTVLFTPLSWLFRAAISVRRFFYHIGLFKSYRFNVPVIVVGNISVGGTGKTPFVVWLAEFLRIHGLKPGIVSRGYGGSESYTPVEVLPSSSPVEVGDEAVLIARRTQCPMVVCVDRVQAVRTLLNKSGCNIVISDDGLQHYRLGRDVEIALVDGVRRFGNGKLLPAGPLREPVSRLKKVDFVVVQEIALPNEYEMQLQGDRLVSLQDPNQVMPLDKLKENEVHAVAGIGHPDRFFNALRAHGLSVITHAFPDHYQFTEHDLQFNDHLPIIMTEKDAVKCQQFASDRLWYLPVDAVIDETLVEALWSKIKSLKSVA